MSGNPRRGRANSPHPNRKKKENETKKKGQEKVSPRRKKPNKRSNNKQTNNNQSELPQHEASSSSSGDVKAKQRTDETKVWYAWLRNILKEGQDINSQSTLEVSRSFMTKLRVTNANLLTSIIQSLEPLGPIQLLEKPQFFELCQLFSLPVFYEPLLQTQVGSIANGVLSVHSQGIVKLISTALQVPISGGELFSLLNLRLPPMLNFLKILLEKLPGKFGAQIFDMKFRIELLFKACKMFNSKPRPGGGSLIPNFEEIRNFTEEIVNSLDVFERSELQDMELQVQTVHNELKEQTAVAAQVTRAEDEAKYAAPQSEALYKYLDIAAIPTIAELRASKAPYDLPAINITDRPYENTHHLLNTQVRLMKEDIVRSLREGTKSWRDGKKRETEDSIHVYNKCTVMSIICDKNIGLIYRLRFQSPRGKAFPWNRSNRLMYGSLVALTADKFNSEPVWAEVSNRDDKFMLNRSFPSIEIRLLRSSQHQSLVELVGMEEHFDLVEASQSYFLPYKHVIEAMQRLGRGSEPSLPFTRYLVDREMDPDPPRYLLGASNYSIFGTEFNILENDQWPQQVNIGNGVSLDDYQTDALKHLLTRELAVVQGPPGTGKTFVALKALQVLLHETNRKKRKDPGPVLIIALTNHALDQLLEGVYKFEPNIIRIGSRSESALLQSRSLHEVRRQMKENQSTRKTRGLGRLFAERESVIRNIVCSIVAMKNGLTLKVLEEQLGNGEPLATEEQINSLRGLYDEQTLQSEDEVEVEDRPTEATEASNRGKKNFKRSRNSKTREQSASASSSSVPVTAPVEDEADQWEKVGPKRRERRIRHHDPVDFWLREAEIGRARAEKKARIQQQLKEKAEAAAAKKTIQTSQNSFAALDEAMNQLNINNKSSASLLTSVSTSSTTAVSSSVAVAWHSSSSQSSAAVMPDDEEFVMIESKRNDEDDENKSEEDEDDVKKEIEERLLEEIPIARIVEEAHAIKQAQCPRNYEDPLNPDNVDDLCALSPHKRECLHWYWLQRYRRRILNKLRPALDQFELLNEEIKEHHRWTDVDILRTARVVGMTTTGAAQFQNLIQLLAPKIVMMEEAAEVLESHVLACLAPSVQHLMLIGDDKQLQPTTSHYDLTRIYKLHISLFERLLKPIGNRRMSHVQLRTQRRMLPSIRELSSFHYQDTITDGLNVNYEPLKGVAHNLYFLSHHHREGGDKAEYEKKNEYEAEMLVKLGLYLISSENLSPTEITLLTTYKGQKRLLTSYVNKLIPSPDDPRRQMLIQVVDKYQGCENTIILLSLVRSNGPQSASSVPVRNPLGYLNVDNRMCVALSRAKRAMFVIGNFDMLKQHNKSWREICSRVEEQGRLGTALPLHCPRHNLPNSVSEPAHFDKVPAGGCLKPCGAKMPCGHQCKKVCHGYDPEHEKTVCVEKCLRTYEFCDHQCQEYCHGGAQFTSEGKKCKPCPTLVQKIVPDCNHAQHMPCHLPPEEFKCEHQVQVFLACGHSITAKCHKRANQFDCREFVKVTRGCGHIETIPCALKDSINETSCPQNCSHALDCGDTCPGNCGQCTMRKSHLSCQKKCTRELKCGHPCSTPHGCKEGCPPCMEMCPHRCAHNSGCTHRCWEPCPPCREKCAWKCAHFECTRACGEPCNRPYCMKPCDKKLPCGHNCIGVCGEPCLSVCRKCNPDVEIMDESFMASTLAEVDAENHFIQLECGHIFEVSSLDTQMSQDLKEKTTASESVEIRLPFCPSCKCKIRNSVRYGTIVNSAIDDIEEIKYFHNLKIEDELEKLWISSVHMKEEERKKWIEVQRKLLNIVEPGGASHYFKCKNGHLYVIGECGGAMEQSTCPECKETIGGGSHKLAEGNRPAFHLGSQGSGFEPYLTPQASDFEIPTPMRQPAPRPPRERRIRFRFAVPPSADSSVVPPFASAAVSSQAASSSTQVSHNHSLARHTTSLLRSVNAPAAIGSSSVGIQPPPQMSPVQPSSSFRELREAQDLEYEEALRMDKLKGLA